MSKENIVMYSFVSGVVHQHVSHATRERKMCVDKQMTDSTRQWLDPKCLAPSFVTLEAKDGVMEE